MADWVFKPAPHSRYPVIRAESIDWVVKTTKGLGDRQRDELGWVLGVDFANVAEIRSLRTSELASIQSVLEEAGRPLRSDANTNNTWLVRDAATYKASELPCGSVEKAVAAEFAYSLWIRRRDAKPHNYAYSEDVPVFFDHHIAFGEDGMADLDRFFRSGQDAGYVPKWRVIQVRDLPTVEEAREYEGRTALACHYVYDLAAFGRELTDEHLRLESIDVERHLDRIADLVYSKQERADLVEFLKRTQSEIGEAMRRLKETIYLLVPDDDRNTQ